MLSENILDYAPCKAGEDFTAEDVARRFNVSLKHTRLTLKRLVDQGSLQTKPDGKFARATGGPYWLRIPWVKKAPDEPGLTHSLGIGSVNNETESRGA